MTYSSEALRRPTGPRRCDGAIGPDPGERFKPTRLPLDRVERRPAHCFPPTRKGARRGRDRLGLRYRLSGFDAHAVLSGR